LPRLPRITAQDLLRALRKDGWRTSRQEGSHITLKHPTKPGYVTVAYHSGTVLNPKTLARILDQAGLAADELRGLL